MLAKRRQNTRSIEFGEIDDEFRQASLRDEMARVVIRSPCVYYLCLDENPCRQLTYEEARTLF